jgi:Tol biopolymer transport system component
LDPDRVWACVELICASKGFARSERLRNLLRRIVTESLANRPEALKESVLASELYRDGKYDPHENSRVRVDAHALRGRLAEYYSGPGAKDEFRIEIPKGTYVAVFHRQEGPQAPSRWTAKNRLLAGSIAISAAILTVLGVSRTPSPVPVKLPVQLTHDGGFTGEPAISPDGRMLVYASDRGSDGAVHIWVNDGDSPPRQLTLGAGHDFRPTLSADGQFVAYRSNRQGAAGIYLVPVKGGEAHLIGANGYAPRFAPKGHELTYTARNPDSPGNIFVVDVDKSVPPRSIDFGVEDSSCPVWTPDGSQIVFLAKDEREELDYWIAPVTVSSRTPSRRLGIRAALRQQGGHTLKEWHECPQDWLDDRLLFLIRPADRSEGIILSTRLSPPEWRVSSLELFEPSLSSGFLRVASLSRHVIYGLDRNARGIWTLTQGRDQPTQFTRVAEDVAIHGGFNGTWPGLSADGKRLCFVTERSGRPDILCRSLEKGADHLVGANPEPKGKVVLDRTGQRLAYHRRTGDQLDLVIRNIADGSERRMLNGCKMLLQWMPDDDSLLCADPDSPRGQVVHAVPVSTQYQRRLFKVEQPLLHAQVSPDSRRIAFAVDSGRNGLIYGYIASLGADAADERHWVKITEEPFMLSLHWAPDGNTVYYWKLRDGFRCLWAQKLHPVTSQPVGEPVAVLHRHGYQAYPTGGAPLAVGGTAARPLLAMNLSDLLQNIWRVDVK